jgi:N-acetylmuramic acid 6-phosphate etherase
MSWDRFEPARRLSSESPAEALRLLIDAETAGAGLPYGEIGRIVRLVDEVAERLAHGGRLLIAAAGPSSHLVQFVTEEAAFWFPGVFPVEALTAESDASEEEAVAAVDESVLPDDAVLCVSRSGLRPWIATVARKANMVGALTASMTCVPDNPVSRESDIPIVLSPGAEVVMGCTLYRAGTVVKVALDAVVLALAVRTGGSLWGDVPVGAKVGADSWRLVAAVAGVDHLRARSLIARADGEVTTAIVMEKLGLEPDEARRRLTEAGGRLDEVIGKP